MNDPQTENIDPKFFERADAHIHLSNAQVDDISPGKVSASMMYATARFNAWRSWLDFENAADMAEQRDDIVAYFLEQYQLMLRDNLDDYIKNFDSYRGTPAGTHPDDE